MSATLMGAPGPIPAPGAAWIIEARVVRDDQRYIFPVAMAGVFLQDPVSSFLAEAIALDEAVRFLGKFVL